MNTEKYLEENFLEIREIEGEMIETYSELEESVSDEGLKNAFRGLKNSEEGHQKILDEIVEILKS